MTPDLMSTINGVIFVFQLLFSGGALVADKLKAPPVVVMPACVQCQTIEMMADGPENMRDGARGTVATPDPQFDANMADWQP